MFKQGCFSKTTNVKITKLSRSLTTSATHPPFYSSSLNDRQCMKSLSVGLCSWAEILWNDICKVILETTTQQFPAFITFWGNWKLPSLVMMERTRGIVMLSLDIWMSSGYHLQQWTKPKHQWTSPNFPGHVFKILKAWAIISDHYYKIRQPVMQCLVPIQLLWEYFIVGYNLYSSN